MSDEDELLSDEALELLRAVIHENAGIEDQGYATGKGACDALFARLVNELRRLRDVATTIPGLASIGEEDLCYAVAGALLVAIHSHGPITTENLDPAVKLIVSNLRAMTVEGWRP